MQERRLRLQRAERGLPDLPALVGSARQRLDDRGTRLGLAWPGVLTARRIAVERAARRLPDLPALIIAARRLQEDRALRLRLALPGLVSTRKAALALSSERLRSALRQATAARAALAARVLPRLGAAPLHARLREAHARLEGLSGRLDSVSHTAVLARGYALVFDSAGAPLTSAATVAPGAALRIRFADGEVRATANGGKGTTRQGSLGL
jgi:exodeoxyribonuclease VII large subunit